MTKTIHTPREELICGKLDLALELLQRIEGGERRIVDLAFLLHSVRHDAERMEAKLVARKADLYEASRLARDGCLVPPDGGSPTEAESDMCEATSRQILRLI